MRIFKDINDLPTFQNAVITIGSFDGLHRGHQKIIQRLNQLAHEIGGESVLITFDPHPRKIIYPKDNGLELLSTLEEKLELCERFEVDNVVIVPFSVEFSQQHPREYIEKFLIGKFHPKFIVIGYDHKFGLNRQGNIDLLKEYESQADFQVIKIQKQELEEITISSTKIRNALKEGNIAEANLFLRYDYILSGTVEHGDKIGVTIGYPTANIKLHDTNKLIPKDGVYAVRVNIEGLVRNGMMYIGNRPTLQDSIPRRKIEVNIFDFNDDIYGKSISVKLLHHIREDMKFGNLDALKAQLRRDKIAVLNSELDNLPEPTSQDNVCIAILNYNGEGYLESYLPSVLYSSAKPINIAVIDNASADDSVEYLEEWHPEVQVIALTKNYGFADGYNRGMEYIKAKYTVILNSDVEVTKNWLDPILEQMEADDTLGIVQPKIKSLEEKSKFEYAGAAGGYLDSLGYPYCRGRIFDEVEEDEGQYDDIVDIQWASGAAMVVRTDLFKNLGGFDSQFFAHYEEIDFCSRVRKAGYKIKVVPTSVVYHLGGGTLAYQSPRKVFLNFRNSLLAILKKESFGKLLWVIPMRLILDGVAGIKFLLGGDFGAFKAIIKAHFSFYRLIPSYLKKRKTEHALITKYAIGSPIQHDNKSTSIVLDHFVKGKKSFTEL